MINLTRKCGSCANHDILEPQKRSDNNNNTSTLTSLKNEKNSGSPFDFSPLNGVIGDMKRSHNDDDSLSSRNSAASTRSSPSHPAPASKIAHKASADSHG